MQPPTELARPHRQDLTLQTDAHKRPEPRCWPDRPVRKAMHPIYIALLERPDLLARHLLAYGDLIGLEARILGRALRLRACAVVLAGMAATLALVWGGIGLMLALLLDRQHPVLWLVPGLALLLAALAAAIALRPLPSDLLGELKAQLQSDLQVLQLDEDRP